MRKESDRRKKRLKGNQIEIPSCRYRGCSRYGVYKWKAMNRWIRGKEIKAEAEWTARWVFRYDKSPRKSPFLPSIPFSRFSRSSPHSASTFAVPPPPPPLFLSCPSYFFCSFFFLFFPPYGFNRRSRATFQLSDRYPDERIRAKWDEDDTPHVWISLRQSSRCHSQLTKWIARLANIPRYSDNRSRFANLQI